MQKMATLWQERSKGEWAHARNWDKAAMTPDLPIITQAVQEGSNTATILSGPSFLTDALTCWVNPFWKNWVAVPLAINSL